MSGVEWAVIGFLAVSAINGVTLLARLALVRTG